MIEVNGKVPMIYNENIDNNMESIVLYFENKWTKSLYENLCIGYKEMSQINLTLAEMGLEEDIKDLREYEARLLGCDKL